MSIGRLPPAIETYLAAENTDDLEVISAFFSADAIVRDEKRTFEGHAAIKEWKADSKKKYHHTVELIDATQQGSKTIVKVRVSGTFPGSPVTLQYSFELDGGKISSLDIR